MSRFNEIISITALATVCVAASPAHAHFKLLTPDSWLNEADDGAPQKGGPCGPGGYDDNGAAESGKITTFHAGDEVPITWEITVPHTGFFQVSVAKDRSELKDPALGEDGLCNYSTPPGDPEYPVISTNIDSTSTSTMVKLPDDLTCDKCTLQVIMWMTNHPPGCIYYHCADIQILPADGSGNENPDGGTVVMGTGGSISMAGTGGMGAAGSGAGNMTGSGGSVANPMTGSGGMTSSGAMTTGSGGTPSMSGAGGMAAPIGTGGATAVMMTPQSSSKTDSGCSVVRARGEAPSALAWLAGAIVLGAAGSRVRRRRAHP